MNIRFRCSTISDRTWLTFFEPSGAAETLEYHLDIKLIEDCLKWTPNHHRTRLLYAAKKSAEKGVYTGYINKDYQVVSEEE